MKLMYLLDSKSSVNFMRSSSLTDNAFRICHETLEVNVFMLRSIMIDISLSKRTEDESELTEITARIKPVFLTPFPTLLC